LAGILYQFVGSSGSKFDFRAKLSKYAFRLSTLSQ
jgi:hypothetical protein